MFTSGGGGSQGGGYGPSSPFPIYQQNSPVNRQQPQQNQPAGQQRQQRQQRQQPSFDDRYNYDRPQQVVYRGRPDLESAGEIYGEVFAPMAERAQALMTNRVGFYPPDSPALPQLTNPHNRAIGQGINMAQQGKAARTSGQNLAELNRLVGRDGLARGTDPAFNTLQGIGTGRLDVGTGSQYQQIYNNALSPQQQAALAPLSGIASGDRQIGTLGLIGGTPDMSDMQRDAAQTYNRMQNNNMRIDPSFYYNARGGRLDVNTRDMGNLARQAEGPSYSEQNLREMALMTPGENPYLDELEGLINDDLAARARASASSVGRGYGSGYESSTTADAIARNILQGRLSQYNLDSDRKIAASGAMDAQRLNNMNLRRGLYGDMAGISQNNMNRRLQASGMADQLRQFNTNLRVAGADRLSGLGQQGIDNRMRRASTLSDVANQNIANQISAAGAQAGIGQTGVQNRLAATAGRTGVEGTNIANMGNAAQADISARNRGLEQQMRASALAPELAAARYADLDRELGYRGIRQDRRDANYAQARADDYQRQQAPWEQLNAYAGLVGAGSIPASSQSYQLGYNQLAQQSGNEPSGLLQGLGYAGLGASALNQAGLLGPLGSAAQSVGGAITSGLF